MRGSVKIFGTLILLMLVLMKTSKEAKSQQLEITSASELNFPLCSVPDTSKTLCQLYNYGPWGIFVESVDLHYYFGDGTDSLVSFILTLPAGGAYNHQMEHVYTAPGIYTMTIILTPTSWISDTLTYVNIVSAGCGTITGQTYVDNNSNCVLDIGDDTLRNFPVYLSDASGAFSAATMSDSSGNYSLLTHAGIVYNASVSPWAYNLSTTCPVGGVYNFTATPASIYYDFGLECLPGFDAQIVSSSTIPIPGSTMLTNFVALNYSCPLVSGTITLDHDSLLTYVSNIGAAPAGIAPGSITWNYSNLNFTSGTIYPAGIFDLITFYTNPLALSGDTLFFTLTITPTAGDIDSTNNVFTYYKIVNAPYDPNMKDVFPVGTGPTGNVAPETEFTYTVFFQNTGTAPAIDVKITDTLDSDLDLMSFQLIGGSHYLTANIDSNDVLTAYFDNINLPDSGSNEPASHGWFMYKVKAKTGLPIGTTILNTANIYFDFNAAIITNTTVNTIDIPSTFIYENNQKGSGIHVYPNPSSTNVNIKLDEAINATIILINITGQIVMTSAINGNSSVINVESLPSGIYQIVIPGTTTLTSRFQKIK